MALIELFCIRVSVIGVIRGKVWGFLCKAKLAIKQFNGLLTVIDSNAGEV